MKDDTYNQLKKELTRYHRKGYVMAFPSKEMSYDEDEKENVLYIQIAMIKKGKEENG